MEIYYLYYLLNLSSLFTLVFEIIYRKYNKAVLADVRKCWRVGGPACSLVVVVCVL